MGQTSSRGCSRGNGDRSRSKGRELRLVLSFAAALGLALAPAVGSAQTRIYMHGAASGVGTYKIADTFAGSSAATAVTNTTAGGTRIQWTQTAGGAAVAWISAPLVAGATVNAGATLSCSAYGLESINAVNASFRCEIYRWVGATSTKEGTAFCAASNATELPRNVADVRAITCTATAKTFMAGDRIVVEWYAVNAGGTMGAGTVTAQYDGAVAALAETWAELPASAGVQFVGTPANLRTTSVVFNRVDLAWDAAAAATGYHLERTTDLTGSTGWAEVTTTASTTFGDTTVAAGATYLYRVHAFNSAQTSPESGFLTVPVPSAGPNPPTGVTATAAAWNRVDVSWTAPASGPEVTSYTVYRSDAPATPIGSVTPPTTSYSDITAQGSTTYTYSVSSVGVSGESSATPSNQVTTPVEPPGAVVNLNATGVQPNRVDLTWDAAPRATEYRIERNPNALGQPSWGQIGTSAGITYADTSVAPATAYQYRVRAYNGDFGAYSNPVSVTTPAAPPAAVTGLQTTAVESRRVALAWNAAARATEYHVERTTDPAGLVDWVDIATTTATSHADTTVVAGTAYVYRVRAWNDGGYGGYSSTVPASPPPAPPDAVANARTTIVESARVVVAWDAAWGATRYHVERNPDASGQGVWAEMGTSGGTAYADTTVASTRTYQYRVRAWNAVGYGPYSNVVVTTTPLPAAPPVTPGSVTAKAESCNRVTVRASYTGDSNGNALVSFARGSSAAGPFTAIAQCQSLGGPVSPRTCTQLGGLTAGQSYWYQATFADADNSPQPAPVVSAAVPIPTCGAVVTLSDPGGQPGNASVEAGSVNTLVGKLVLSAANGGVEVSGLRVENVATSSERAAAGTDVLSLQLWRDAGVPGVFEPTADALLATSQWDSASGKYAFRMKLQLDSGASALVFVTANVAPGARVGKKLDASVASDDLTVSTAGASVALGATVASAGVFTVTPGPIAGSADVAAPMVSIVNPGPGAAVSGSYRVQVQVFDRVGLANVQVAVTTDAWTTFLPLAQTSTYAVGTNAAIYEGTIANPVPGAYRLQARVTNTATTKQVLSVPVLVTVNSARAGDGVLLRRDNSPQLCSDCHAIQSHSSQAAASPSTGNSKYGSWSTNCRDCHTPHGTTNVYLVKKEITPPPVGGAYQESKKVFFSDPTRGYSTATPGVDPGQVGSAAYANQDYTGVCQVCHTRTADKDGNPLFRNSIGADATHGSGTRCGDCHSHTRGFRPSCTGCHGEAGRASFEEAAPPRDTCGNLAPQPGSVTNRVGAHQAHLAGSTLTDGVGCDGCHVNPPTRAGHPADTQCSALEAERAVLQWGPLAKGEVDPWSGAVTPSAYQYGTQSCSSTYCHGAFRNSGVAGTVAWNESVACGDCHDAPPPSPIHTTNTRCDWCHGAGYALAGVTGAARTTHVDGRLQRLTVDCTSCHGTPALASAPGVETQDDRFRSAPPQDTLGNAATTFRGVGAHRSHVYDPVLRRPLLCADCHSPVPTDPMHSDGPVQLGFSAFASGGGAGVLWTGTPELSCWATYCHGDNFGPATKGAQTRPSWVVVDGSFKDCGDCHQAPPDDPQHTSVPKPSPATECHRCHDQTVLADGSIDLARGNHVNGSVELGGVTCHSCHGDETTHAPPPVANSANLNGAGAHRQHVLATMTLRPGSFACTECHPDNAGSYIHANGTPDMVWDAGMAPSTIWNDGSSTCASASCHGGAAWGGSAPSPVWTTVDGTYKACGACHSNPPPLNDTTHHPPNASCDLCHRPGATTTTITGNALSKHIDGEEDLVRSGCTLCHGDLTMSGVGPTDPNVMPGYTAAAKDVTGGLSPLISGAHLKHLTGTAIARTRGGTAPNGFAAACGDCHQVPGVDDRSHATGVSTSGSRASVPFNGFATRNGAYPAQYQDSDTATANTHAGQCSNVYCHGAKFVGNANFETTVMAPSWTQGSAATSCGTACHKVYPTSNGHRDVVATTNCVDCHEGYDCTQANLAACTVNYTHHINGTPDVSVPMTCTSCHGSATGSRALLTTVGAADLTRLAAAPPRDTNDQNASNQVGAHQAHVNPDPSQAIGQVFLPIPCTECHTNAVDSFPMEHQDGERLVAFQNSVWSNQAGYVSTDTPSDGTDAGTPATCTSYCHISSYPANVRGSVSTWEWTTTLTVTCGSCHGSPPPDPDHTSVPKPSATTACYASCHSTTVNAQGKIIFSGSGESASTLHINGTPNTSGVTCETCHGDAARAWDPLADAQQRAAPPKGTSGSSAATDRGVGTHDEHVYGRASKQVPCAECHLAEMPAQNKHASGASTITGNFGPLATRGGVTPTYNADRTCSGTYCHGNFPGGVGAGPTPAFNWSSGTPLACTACHGTPPSSSNHSAGDTACGDCHPGNTISTVDKAKHVDGVVDGNFTCLGCHQNAKDVADVPGSRRAVLADFSKQSHHVGNGGWMGGALTNNDCAVCHAEATVTTPGAEPTANALHKNGLIDLRDADDATKYFQYDNNTVKGLGVASANSGNVTWQREMSGRLDNTPGDWDPAFVCSPAGATGCSKGLDRFCISCHDEDGASSSEGKGELAATPLNPFNDGANTIGNNYDQANRGRVVDIASRVDERARRTGGTRWTAQDRDPPLRTGYLTAQSPPSQPDRGPDGRNDPPYGVFSRHAIRGLSVSVYGTTNAGWDTTTNWAKTWARSNAVLGCGDCHTTDGANSPTGNAHGSPSEYLLKDASGTANEGTLAGNSYVCYICHAAAQYNSNSLHTTSASQDYTDYTGFTGLGATGRVPVANTGGNVYGYACGNCHGGTAPTKAGATLPVGVTTPDSNNFGTIHGTSQVLGYGAGGGAAGTAYRSAYRFSNGASMRYYDPGGWSGNASGRSCYTISGGEDAWSGCVKHSGQAGAIRNTSVTPAMQRPLKY